MPADPAPIAEMTGSHVTWYRAGMKSFAVLTASGADRVGIVNEISTSLLEAGCNIEESRMSVLGGEFALIVLVSAESDVIRQLLNRLEPLGKQIGLDLTGRPTGPYAVDPTARPYSIECVSLDTPGIVHSVTELLHRRGVNIDELETNTTGAPFTGAPMFHMRIVAIIPEGLQLRQLREELAKIAAEADLDITVKPILSGPEE
jgi:glycine cleavage system transcriptional repressor